MPRTGQPGPHCHQQITTQLPAGPGTQNGTIWARRPTRTAHLSDAPESAIRAALVQAQRNLGLGSKGGRQAGHTGSALSLDENK